MTVAANASASTRTRDDLRVQAAVETIRGLRAAGVNDPFAALRADLRDRFTSAGEDKDEARQLLLLVEALTALAAEAEATALLHD